MLVIILNLFLLSCSTTTKVAPVEETKVLRITEVSPNKWTGLTRQNLEQLLGVYKLSPVIYTEDVVIQSGVVPRSHPVLTINTRYAENPQKILSVFVHEQFHWWTEKNKARSQKAAQELTKLYPEQDKAQLEHILICFLEYEALMYFLSKHEAEIILRDFILENIHPWIYAQVMANYPELNKVILRNELKPQFLMKQPQKPTKKPPLSSESWLKNLYRSLALSFVNSDPTPMQLI